jgi:hypothetical protein
MRNLVLFPCLVLLLSLCFPLASFAADAGAPGDLDAVLELLQKKGVLSPEESAAARRQSGGASGRGGLKAVLKLLRDKGVVSDEESAALTGASASAAPSAAAPAEAAPGKKTRIRVDADLLRAELNLVFVKQGVLGADEAEQIAERIGKKRNPADEDDTIAPPDGEIEYHKTTLPKAGLVADIDRYVAMKLISPAEAERIKARLDRKLALERVMEGIDREMHEQVNQQVAAKIVPVPEWTTRVKVGGDFRLRYEGDFFDGDGGFFDAGNGLFVKPDNPTQLANSWFDRHQVRIRARLNVTAKVNDEVEVGIGLATGNTTNPVSTNATLGDSLNKKNFLLDLAYLKYTPTQGVTLLGGRFANPWFSTDLVWDQDVNFDGLAFTVRPKLTPKLELFLTGGAFPIQEIEFSSHDKWLFAGQLGLNYRNDTLFSATLAAAFYDFEHVTGIPNDPSRPGANDFSAPLYQQKGNTLFDIDPAQNTSTGGIKTAYAAEFRELNITGSLDLGFWDPIRVILTGDYVNNIGYDSAYVNSLTGAQVKKQTEGFQAGISVGYPETREFGQWKVLGYYKYLEPDAVIDAFTDSDFHLGGTNAKGWIAGGDFGLGKNCWLSTRWLTSNEIAGPPLAIDVFQFNVNAKF